MLDERQNFKTVMIKASILIHEKASILIHDKASILIQS